jgi:hypothetical protein
MIKRGWIGSTAQLDITTNGNAPVSFSAVDGGPSTLDPSTFLSSYSVTYDFLPITGLFEVLDIGITDVVVGPGASMLGSLTDEYTVAGLTNQAWIPAAYGAMGATLDISVVDVNGVSVIKQPDVFTADTFIPAVELPSISELTINVSPMVLHTGLGVLGAGKSIDVQVAINPDGTPIAARQQQLIL